MSARLPLGLVPTAMTLPPRRNKPGSCGVRRDGAGAGGVVPRPYTLALSKDPGSASMSRLQQKSPPPWRPSPKTPSGGGAVMSIKGRCRPVWEGLVGRTPPQHPARENSFGASRAEGKFRPTNWRPRKNGKAWWGGSAFPPPRTHPPKGFKDIDPVCTFICTCTWPPQRRHFRGTDPTNYRKPVSEAPLPPEAHTAPAPGPVGVHHEDQVRRRVLVRPEVDAGASL